MENLNSSMQIINGESIDSAEDTKVVSLAPIAETESVAVAA